MIDVTIHKKNDNVEKIVISGHAEYDIAGKDIVCAAVSGIAVGAVNAMYENDCNIEHIMNDGYIKLVVLDYEEKLKIMIDMLICQLKTVEISYGQFIKIKYMEV